MSSSNEDVEVSTSSFFLYNKNSKRGVRVNEYLVMGKICLHKYSVFSNICYLLHFLDALLLTFVGSSFSAEDLLDDGASSIVPLLLISSLRSTTRKVEEFVFAAADDFPLFVLVIEAVLLTITDNPFFIWLFKVFDSFSPYPLNVPDLA